LWRNLFKVAANPALRSEELRDATDEKDCLTLWTLLAAVFVTTEAIAQDGYRIRSGDVLAVEVIQDPNLNREVLVLPDGSISFPFRRNRAAGGLTTGQVQAQIAQGISPNFAVQPTVFVTVRQVGTPTGVGSARTIDVFYLGEVNAPGMVEVEPGHHAFAGSVAGRRVHPFAATRRIQLRRTHPHTGETSMVTLDYRALSDGGTLRNDPVLADGDVILVPDDAADFSSSSDLKAPGFGGPHVRLRRCCLRHLSRRRGLVSTQTELRYEQRTFGGAATSDDTRTHSIRSTLRFTIDPRIELRFSGFAEEKETDDALDTVRTVQRWSLAGDFDIDRVWTAGANIGFAEIETETIGGTAVEEGLEAGFLISRALRNGGLSFSSALVITDDGWRNSVRLSRVINLANGDSFNASIGQIFFEEGSSGHLAALSYTRTVRSGFLSFGFDYASDLDDADLLIQRTRANAVLRQDITDNSGWVLDGALASVMYDNPITPDAVRFDVGLSYLHGLSNDWNLAARVEHQVLYEDGAIDDTTNVFSLTLERRFSARP
jgi:polysaccharide export outer membrane protein